MATFVITKSDNQVSINDYIDQFPQDYDVFIDELNNIVVIKSGSGSHKWEIKTLTDDITVNGESFTGTAAALKSLLFSAVFVQASGGSSVVGYPEGTKIYVALLTQTGENAPVATVLVNTLGGTVVWTRLNPGVYVGTLSGAFTENKTATFLEGVVSADILGMGRCTWGSVDTVSVLTANTTDGTNLDDQLLKSTVQILVLP